MTTVRAARYPEDGPAIRGLLEEYHGELDVDLCFQNFAAEVAGLPGEYQPPDGALLVAVDARDRIVGCVAVHRFEGEIAEMKRLFVTGAARGGRTGRDLAVAIIDAARTIGYRRIRLDSLPSQTAAHGLYRSLGFGEIPAYQDNPIVGTRYFELVL